MSSLLDRRVDLTELHPIVRQAVHDIQTQLNNEGFPFRIFEAYRSPQRQNYLYAQGRTRAGGIVTYKQGWGSNHQYGLAVDFVLYINGTWNWSSVGRYAKAWQRLHEVAKLHGMHLLDFEQPHVELNGFSPALMQAGHYPEEGDESWAKNLETMIVNWQGDNEPPVPKIIERPPFTPQEAELAKQAAQPISSSAPLIASFNRKAFYNALRSSLYLSSYTTQQVSGISDVLDAWFKYYPNKDKRWLAYILATVYHETGRNMFPVREGFAASDAQAIATVTRMYNQGRISHNYALPVNGRSYFGRGRVQNTFYDNYRNLSKRFGLDFVRNPSLLLDSKIDAMVTVVGHVEGIWTKKRLADYISPQQSDYVGARQIINGKDRAQDVANYAYRFETAINLAYSTHEILQPQLSPTPTVVSGVNPPFEMEDEALDYVDVDTSDINTIIPDTTYAPHFDENLDTQFAPGIDFANDIPLSASANPEIAARIDDLSLKMDALLAQNNAIVVAQNTPATDVGAINAPSSAPPRQDSNPSLLTRLGLNKELTPVNAALGTTIGSLLDGRKTGLGILGILGTTYFSDLAPDMNSTLSQLSTITPTLKPIFYALSAWGILGKVEKWVYDFKGLAPKRQ